MHEALKHEKRRETGSLRTRVRQEDFILPGRRLRARARGFKRAEHTPVKVIRRDYTRNSVNGPRLSVWSMVLVCARPHTMRYQLHSEMIGTSPEIIDLQQEIERVARSDAKVLVTGESGVGKELVARAVHDFSP